MNDDYFDEDEFFRRLDLVALRILEEARIRLMMSFRFFDQALWRLPVSSASLEAPLSTDGHVLYYDATRLAPAYKRNPNLAIRSYLHAILHCVFRHPFHTIRISKGLWSLACDICVEYIAAEMCRDRFPLPTDDKVIEIGQAIADAYGGCTPALAYKLLLTTTTAHLKALNEIAASNFLAPRIEASRDVVALDSHELWDLLDSIQHDEDRAQADMNDEAAGEEDREDGGRGETRDDERDQEELDDKAETELTEVQGGENGEGEGGEEADNGGDGERVDRDLQDMNESKRRAVSQDGGSPASALRESDDADAEPGLTEQEDLMYHQGEGETSEDDWLRISRELEANLQSLGQVFGDGSGSFAENLTLANRSKVDYRQFLRRFAVMSEDMVLNDEEFDYVFYTYGLDLYGNMPLLEPLEYKDEKRIREFVIAIDTSGSCSRGLVQGFLTRTCEVLAAAHSFTERVNIHIIQCDAELQSDTVITSREELQAYGRNFEARGYGGTDFRPVFAYVNDLVARNEFTDLKGLVYFTDGYGVFPQSPPPYETAFVFLEDAGRERRVPPWAMKVILGENDLQEIV